jgi:hypothetical protein
LDAFDAGERFLGLANIVAAILQTVQSAVDPSRRGADIVTVAIGIELPPLPIFAGDLQRQRGLRSQGRIFLEIDPERFAVFGIVGAAGKLQQAAPLVEAAITLLDVAEILAALIGSTAGKFLRGTKAG